MSYPLLDFEDIISLLEVRFSHTFLSLNDLPSPYMFKDMKRSVERIIKAIKEKEKIVLVGDYDVDGVMAASMASLFFQEIGYPVEVIIPNRFSDGYGLSPKVLERIDEADLIFTVDNGIAAIEAADICRDREIDLIITDHHLVPDIPPDAYAIIDQKQPDCTFPYEEVCGAQIAWYMCAAINRELNTKINMKKYLDITAVAIIADMMPLTHINRAMVQAGLQQFTRSDRPFAKAYREMYPRSTYSAEDLAFGLAPMINSAGRLEDASIALDFVTAPNIYEARIRLEKLAVLNNTRKRLEQEATDEAMTMADQDSKILVVKKEGWHEGVVGIVAARLARRFERPAIVLSQNGNICKGSGRSWRECHLYDLLSMQRKRMLKFGGHKSAIGMSIECGMVDEFALALQKDAAKQCKEENDIDTDILGILPFGLIGSHLLRVLEKFEPFGQGNPKPKFITRGVMIASAKTMGKENNHLRFSFQSDDIYIQGVQFRTTQQYTAGTKADIIYTLNENHFRGETTIQLMVEKVDVRNE
jgi:single-stranded-DNA-specific exonuclease